MEEYRRGSHSVFRLHVHVVWCTKYRKAALVKDVGHRFRELARQVCSDLGVEIISGVVAKDHVHILEMNGESYRLKHSRQRHKRAKAKTSAATKTE